MRSEDGRIAAAVGGEEHCATARTSSGDKSGFPRWHMLALIRVPSSKLTKEKRAEKTEAEDENSEKRSGRQPRSNLEWRRDLASR